MMNIIRYRTTMNNFNIPAGYNEAFKQSSLTKYLSDVYTCTVTEKISGELECKITMKYSEFDNQIEMGDIICVCRYAQTTLLSNDGNIDYFVVYRIEQDGTIQTVYSQHLTYALTSCYTNGSSLGKTYKQVLQHKNFFKPNDIKFDFDFSIGTPTNTDYLDNEVTEVKSIRELLFGTDGIYNTDGFVVQVRRNLIIFRKVETQPQILTNSKISEVTKNTDISDTETGVYGYYLDKDEDTGTYSFVGGEVGLNNKFKYSLVVKHSFKDNYDSLPTQTQIINSGKYWINKKSNLGNNGNVKVEYDLDIGTIETIDGINNYIVGNILAIRMPSEIIDQTVGKLKQFQITETVFDVINKKYTTIKVQEYEE